MRPAGELVKQRGFESKDHYREGQQGCYKASCTYRTWRKEGTWGYLYIRWCRWGYGIRGSKQIHAGEPVISEWVNEASVRSIGMSFWRNADGAEIRDHTRPSQRKKQCYGNRTEDIWMHRESTVRRDITALYKAGSWPGFLAVRWHWNIRSGLP